MNSQAATAVAKRVAIVSESDERRTHWHRFLASRPEFAVVDVGTADRDLHAAADVVIYDLDVDIPLTSIPLPPDKAALILLLKNPDPTWLSQSLPVRPIAVLSRDCRQDQLLAAVQAVSAGLVVFEQHVADAWLRTQRQMDPVESGEEELTSRETDVLRMMTEGLTNREIASMLLISEHTVKFHIASIFGKLGTSTRTEAVTEGLRRRLIIL